MTHHVSPVSRNRTDTSLSSVPEAVSKHKAMITLGMALRYLALGRGLPPAPRASARRPILRIVT
jgi:hypothetical protein